MFACFADARKAAVRVFILMTLILVSACTVPTRLGETQNTGQRIDPNAPVQVALLVPGGTGNEGRLSASLENAARLAISDLNGVQINLRVYNTAGDPLQAARVANAAVDDGAMIILGPLFGEAANAAGVSVANRNVNVLAFSNNPAIAGGNVFVLGTTFSNTATRLVQYAGRQGINRYTAARNGGSDAVFFTGDASSDLPFILNGLNSAGLSGSEAKFIGLTRWDANVEVLTSSAAQGGIIALPDQALIGAFESRYSATYGDRPHPLAGLAYDGIAAIGALVAQGNANALTKNALTTSQGFQGTGGIFRFLPNGLNQRGLAIAEIRNNQVITLEAAPRSFGGSGL